MYKMILKKESKEHEGIW